MKKSTSNFTVLIKTDTVIPLGIYSLSICGVENRFFIDTINVYKKEGNIIFAKFTVEYTMSINYLLEYIKEISFSNPFGLIKGVKEIIVRYDNILFTPVWL